MPRRGHRPLDHHYHPQGPAERGSAHAGLDPAGKAIEHFRDGFGSARIKTPILISLTVSPIRNAAGQIIGASKIARDITAQVEGEGDREILLARERAARREAESANRAKDEFLAMLGHELRNPLGAISNAAHVLERLGQPGDATAAIRGIIGRQTAHLARLTDDLLDIGRVMVGKVVLDMKAGRPARGRRTCDRRPAGGRKNRASHGLVRRCAGMGRCRHDQDRADRDQPRDQRAEVHAARVDR